MLGATNPLASAAGTIRGDFGTYRFLVLPCPLHATLLGTNLSPSMTFSIFLLGIDMGRNICHGSDSVESAKKEIGMLFNLRPRQTASIGLGSADTLLSLVINSLALWFPEGKYQSSYFVRSNLLCSPFKR
jgi:nucleoside-diphosphate kinase